MAKVTLQLQGDFSRFVQYIRDAITGGSISATIEDEIRYQTGDVDVAITVFERYSIIGSNRVSMNVTITGHNNNLTITAITSGGSQAVLFKINTFGEEAFLDKFVEAIRNFR